MAHVWSVVGRFSERTTAGDNSTATKALARSTGCDSLSFERAELSRDDERRSRLSNHAPRPPACGACVVSPDRPGSPFGSPPGGGWSTGRNHRLNGHTNRPAGQLGPGGMKGRGERGGSAATFRWSASADHPVRAEGASLRRPYPNGVRISVGAAANSPRAFSSCCSYHTKTIYQRIVRNCSEVPIPALYHADDASSSDGVSSECGQNRLPVPRYSLERPADRRVLEAGPTAFFGCPNIPSS